MALNACQSCTTRFAVGLKRCPHCGSTDFCEDEQMAKITAHGGATDKTLTPAPEPEAVDVAAAEPPDATEDQAAPAQPEPAAEGREESSPGNSSPASTETPQPNSEPSAPTSPKRARTTGSRSKKAPTANPSAPSTAGAQTDATSAADSTEA